MQIYIFSTKNSDQHTSLKKERGYIALILNNNNLLDTLLQLLILTGTGTGLEAPRNSVEMPVEAFQNYLSVGDDVPCNYQVKEDWFKKDRYPTEAPMKKLISEEISERPNTRQNGPGIVARLMGLDILPLDTQSLSQQVEERNEKPGTSFPKEKQTKNDSKSLQIELKPFHHSQDRDPYQMKLKKPAPREHPQEEELQKFKKEFEAFQAERLKECSKVLELGGTITNSRRITNELPKKLENHTVKARPLKRGGLLNKNKHFPDEERESVSLKRKMLSRVVDQSSGPTRIVILKPGPGSTVNSEEFFASSSGTSEERDNMEDFLDEVKTRLKYELQEEKYKRGTTVTLLRSESSKSQRSEIQYDETCSPEFRDTRRFFSERLRNVLKEETHRDAPMVAHKRSRSSMVDDQRIRLGSSEILNVDIQSRSFRYGADDELSPKNLIRSLSAPVSGTSFGKLLLEDRHILTGAQIRRKHEVIERAKKDKKEKLNLREKVHSFKYSFTLRGRLFGRKYHLAEEPLSKKLDVMKDIMSGPTVMMNFYDRYENSTEVPPSPVSVCSSVHEELWRSAGDQLSPTITSDVPPLENALPQVFKEIGPNLNDLEMQPNQLETHDFESTITREEALEVERVELEEAQAKTYIRDLLVASGLYGGSSYTSLISYKKFEEVEILYRTKNKANGWPTKDHKLLFDLSNEALSTVLGPPQAQSKFRINDGDTMLRPPRGRNLLDRVWEITRVYLYPPMDNSYHTLDWLIARDLKSIPWLESTNDDVDGLGKEVEFQILGDLIEEIVKDMQLR
ncbi:hypothetical protein LguiB_018930 [Lonicera macranthoides]